MGRIAEYLTAGILAIGILMAINIGYMYIQYQANDEAHISSASHEFKIPDSIEGSQIISAAGLFASMYGSSSGNVVLIDSRTRNSYETAHIPGAVSLPASETNAETITQYAGKSDFLVFYCGGVKCGASVGPVKLAVHLGYTNVYWFRGGIAEWKNRDYPLNTI